MNQFSACVLSAAAILLMATSCHKDISGTSSDTCLSTGPVITSQRQISQPAAISVARGIGVEYRQSDTLSLTVSAPDDIIDMIVTELNGKTLVVTAKNNLGECANKVKVSVSAPAITNFDICAGSALNIAGAYSTTEPVSISSSSGAAFNAGSMAAESITCDASSGAAVNIFEISADKVSGSASSGAAMNLAGKCTTANFAGSSGAVVSAGSLKAAKGNATASSGAVVTCSIHEILEEASSGGSVNNR